MKYLSHKNNTKTAGGHPHVAHPLADPAVQPPDPQELLRRHAEQRPLRMPRLRHVHDTHEGKNKNL